MQANNQKKYHMGQREETRGLFCWPRSPLDPILPIIL